ncbi:hypothetical protein KAR91_10770 [Candidatus Pacearchaeota archaeon]|nr:hypothetical protein [Candidatus Pacearchaeota archaeon]
MKYKPSKESKTNEDAIKNPLIAEHNIMGAKFKAGKITDQEWSDFKKDWMKRFTVCMHNVTKNRLYKVIS